MIRHSHIRTDDIEVMQLYTKRMTDSDPLKGIRRHFEVCIERHRGDVAKGTRGKWFEICCFDAFVKLGHQPVTHKYEPKQAELDFWFAEQRIGVHAKTSVRERWRQADRDALVYRLGASGVQPKQQLLLIHKEQPGHTVRQCVNKCRALEEKAVALDRVFSACVPQHMEELELMLS